MLQRTNGAAGALETLTGNIQYYSVFASSPNAFSNPLEATGINIKVTRNYRDESQKNFEVLVQAIGLRAMPVILTDPMPVKDLSKYGAPSLVGEGFVWKFASELEFVYENFGPKGTIGPVGFLIDELHGIVLPSGEVIRTKEIFGSNCANSPISCSINMEFLRSEFL